jgi:hypothetical protein
MCVAHKYPQRLRSTPPNTVRQAGRQAGVAPVVLCASAYLRFVKLCAELSFLSLQGLLLCLQARAAGCQLYVVVYAALHGG